jgi:Cu/Ag efflux protein CusF
MKTFHLLTVALIVVSAAGVHAQTNPTTPRNSAAAAASMTDGEVRKVDHDAGKVTLRHGPIANLDMPGMTMVFKATDPKMLENLKEGDKVRFSADRVNGSIAVTRIEVVN